MLNLVTILAAAPDAAASPARSTDSGNLVVLGVALLVWVLLFLYLLRLDRRFRDLERSKR